MTTYLYWPYYAVCMGTHTDKRSELARLMEKCRSERGISLHSAAKRLGIHYTGLSKIERGLTKPRRTTALKIVDFLRAYGYFPRAAA